MCTTNACPCAAGGNTADWNDLTQDELLTTYKSTRIAGTFYFTETGGYNSYDECIKNV